MTASWLALRLSDVYICIGNLTIIGSDDGLSPVRCQAIIWTNDGVLLIKPLGTNYSEILIEMQTLSCKKMHLKMSSGKCPPFYPCHNILTHGGRDKMADIFQTTFSNAFSLMKIYEFSIRFHWSLFLRFKSTIFQHWFRWWLGADQATSHCLNQWWFNYWRIYASLGLNELTKVLDTWGTWKSMGIRCTPDIFPWRPLPWNRNKTHVSTYFR